MLRILFGYLIVLILSFNLSHPADATTIVLASGERITGKIIEQTPLHIMLNVSGIPETFYLGEIATIDGEKTTILPINTDNIPPALISSKDVPHYNDEEILLIKLMKMRLDKEKAVTQDVPKKSLKSNSPVLSDPVKNVFSTADGGIIVVKPEKIIKYDKDLNLIKAVDLKA